MYVSISKPADTQIFPSSSVTHCLHLRRPSVSSGEVRGSRILDLGVRVWGFRDYKHIGGRRRKVDGRPARRRWWVLMLIIYTLLLMFIFNIDIQMIS